MEGRLVKLGLIRCQQTEDMCAAKGCLAAISKKLGSFSDVDEDIELIGVNTCGGCPGKKAATRSKRMVEQGADAIALSTCISKGTPIEFKCPNKEQMQHSIEKLVGPDIKIFEYTHD